MDLLDRLHERLLAAIASGHDASVRDFTIADLYQRLVPYRAVRGQVGVIELAEYEHALLRLLSGERNYLEVADSDVRLEIQRELASLNPILGIYRDYSTATLRVNPANGAAMSERQEEPDEVTSPRADASAPGEQVMTAGSTIPSPGGFDSLTAVPKRSSGPRSECEDCGRSLPMTAAVRFCPYCGSEQAPEPCAHCGAAMEREWSFCIQCGTRRAAQDASS